MFIPTQCHAILFNSAGLSKRSFAVLVAISATPSEHSLFPADFHLQPQLRRRDKKRKLDGPLLITLRVRRRKTTPCDADLTQGFLMKSALVLLAVNKHIWHGLTGSSSCYAGAKGCHKLLSKKHASILDIKCLAPHSHE